MSKQNLAALQSKIEHRLGGPSYATIDPTKLKKWIDIILQFLPIFLAFFSAPTPPPVPPPIQAGASITTIDGLLDYVEAVIELCGLNEEQAAKVTNAIDALCAFMTM